jgi:acyl dehydratase
MPEIFFEDLAVGDTREFGRYEVTEDEVLEFAERWDPQWFHTQPERAADSIYGGLIASGWHTCAMTMRMLVDHHFSKAASMGAIGLEELRWPNPVRPGETLSVQSEVTEKRASESKPDRGVVRTRTTTVNEDGEAKLEMESLVLYGRRD